MNFLQLVDRLGRECGVSGGALSTVIGQSGETQRLINWISQAWYELQEEYPNFDWMRNEVSFTTTTGQASYTPAQCGVTDLGKWKMDSFRCYQTSVGYGSEIFLSNVDYEAWRNHYQFNAIRNTSGRPITIAQAPDLSLCLGPKPNDDGYTVIGQYWRTPTMMTADADIPAMPERFHMAIVYRAMMDYASYEAAIEVHDRGERKYNEMMRRIEASQLPGVSVAGAML